MGRGSTVGMDHIQADYTSAVSPKAPAELQDLAAKPVDQRDMARVKSWKKGFLINWMLCLWFQPWRRTLSGTIYMHLPCPIF